MKLREGETFLDRSELIVISCEDREISRLISLLHHCENIKEKRLVSLILEAELTRIGYIPEEEDSDKPGLNNNLFPDDHENTGT